MRLTKLFEMQEILDKHIMDEHPELRDQDNIDWKILALQVELGECANEWRGFKKWSKDQEPRTTTKCHHCSGEGMGFFSGNQYTGFKEICIVCDGTGINDNQNPLLEEYVDCLHFILSIGLEFEEFPLDMDYEVLGYIKSAWNTENTIKQFQEVFNDIAVFSNTHDETDYVEIVSQFLALGEMLNFSWEEVEQAYMEKNAINHQRQESGY